MESENTPPAHEAPRPNHVPILNLSQLHAETFNPANRSKRNAPIVALPTKAQPQNTDRQQSNQSDIQKSDVVISPRALSPSYLNSTESSKRRSASTEKTERALLLPKSVMSPSKSSSMVVSDKPSKPVSLNLNTADTEARAITSPPRVSVRNSTTAATLAKQVHRVSRTESVSPPRPRSATAIARAAAAAETHIRRLHKLQEPEIVPVRSERKIVRAPQSRVTLTETTNIEMPVESELDSEHGHNAMVDSVPAASDPPSPASFLSSFISNNPFAGSTSFAYPIMSTPAQSNRSFVTDTSASPETPHVTNSSSTLAFDSNRTHFQDLTTPVPPSKVTDYGSPVLKATTQSIPAISSTAILSSPAQVFCLPVEEPTPAVSLSDSAPNETPNETVSVTHFAELEQSRKTIETLISEIETLKSRNSDLCNLLESSTAAHQSTQDQLNLAQQSLLQSQTFNKDLQERIASLKHDVSAVELQRQRLESDFALEKALKQRAESELQTVKGELHALQQTINTERDRVKVLGDDKSAWLARIQKAESELALVNADRATKLDRAAAEANTLVEQTRAKFEQLLAANRASSEAEISSLRHQLTSLQAAKPSVTPSIPNTTVCQCAEARKQCYSSLIDTRLEADQLRASLTELRAQLDSEVRKATLHAEQEVAQCRTNVMDIQQQHRQATFALQSQLDACKFELLQTNTELTFARQILLQRVTSDQEIMNDDESSAELESLVENTDLMRRVYERNTISSEDDTIKQLPVRMQRQLKANEELREAQQLLGELAHNTLRSANGANSKRKQTESMSALSLSDPSEHVSFVQLQNALKFAAKYGADGAEKLRVDFSSRLFSAHQELTRISSTTKPEPESNRSTLSESRIAKSIPLTSALLQIQSHKPATLESLQQLLDASHKEHQAEHELWTDRINSLEASVASAQLSVACLKQECEAERSMRNEVVQQVRDSQEKAENALSQLFQFESAAAQKSLAHHHQLAQVESKYVDLLQSEDTKHQETLREQQQRYNELESLLKQQITSLSQDIDAFKQALDQSQVDAHEARQAIESAQQRQQESEAALVQEREAMKMASEQLKELHQEKILELEQKELDLISQHSTVEGLLKQQLQDASETHTMDCAKIAELETSVSNLNTQLGLAQDQCIQLQSQIGLVELQHDEVSEKLNAALNLNVKIKAECQVELETMSKLHSEAEANWTASRSQLEKQHSEQLVSMEQHHAFAIETLQKALDSLQIALQHCQSEKDVAQSDLKHKSIEVDEMRQLLMQSQQDQQQSEFARREFDVKLTMESNDWRRQVDTLNTANAELKQQLVDALEMQSQLNITLESVTEQLRANETQRLAALQQVTEATSELSRTQLLLEDAESSVDQLRDQLADTLNRHIVERNAFESQIAQLKSDFQISSDQANAEFNAKLHLHEQHARDSESALHSTISQLESTLSQTQSELRAANDELSASNLREAEVHAKLVHSEKLRLEAEITSDMKRSPSVPAEPEPAELIEEIRQLKLQLTQQISHQQQLQQQHEIMLKATRAQADSLREKLSESDREIERLKEQFKVDEAAVQKQRHDEQVEFAQREQLLRLQIFELQNSESKTIEQASPKSAVESDSHLSAPSLEVTEMRALISSMQNTTNSELDNGFKQHSLDLSLKLREAEEENERVWNKNLDLTREVTQLKLQIERHSDELASVQHNAQLQLQSFESDRIKLTQEIAQFQAEQQRWAAEIEPQAKVVSDLRAALALAQNQAATAQLECAQARLEQRLQHSRSVDELPHDITNQESAEDLHSTMPSFQRSATMATSSQRTKSTRPSRTNDAIDDVKAQVRAAKGLIADRTRALDNLQLKHQQLNDEHQALQKVADELREQLERASQQRQRDVEQAALLASEVADRESHAASALSACQSTLQASQDLIAELENALESERQEKAAAIEQRLLAEEQGDALRARLSDAMAEQASMLAVHEQHNTEMSDEFSQKLRNVELEFEQKLQAQLQDHQVFVQELNEQLRALEDDADSAKLALMRSQTDCQVLKTRLQTSTDDMSSLRMAVSTAESRREVAVSQITSLTEQLTDLQSRLEQNDLQLSDYKVKCEESDQRYGEVQQQHQSELSIVTEKFNLQSVELKSVLQKLANTDQELQQTKLRLSSAVEQSSSLSIESQKNQSEISQLQSEVSRLQSELSQSEQSQNTLITDLKLSNSRTAQLEQELASSQHNLQSLEGDFKKLFKEHKTTKSSLQAAQTQNEQLSMQVSTINTKAGELQHRAGSIEQQFAETTKQLEQTTAMLQLEKDNSAKQIKALQMEISELENELDTIKVLHQQTIVELKHARDADITELKSHFERERSQMSSINNAIKTQHQLDLDSVKTHFQSQLAVQHDQHSKDVSGVQARHQVELNALRDELEASRFKPTEQPGEQHQVSFDALSQQYSALSAQYDVLTQESSTLKSQSQIREAQVASLSAETSSLKAQLVALLQESTGLKSELVMVSQDRITLQTQLATLSQECTALRAQQGVRADVENATLQSEIETLATECAALTALLQSERSEKSALSLNNSNLILDLDNQKSQLIAMHQQLSDTHVQHSANLQQQQQLHDDQFNALKEQYEALQTERNELVQLSESVQQQQQRHNEQFNILQQQYQTLMTERDGVVQARDALKSELSVARADLQHKIDSDKAELNQLLTEQTQTRNIVRQLVEERKNLQQQLAEAQKTLSQQTQLVDESNQKQNELKQQLEQIQIDSQRSLEEARSRVEAAEAQLSEAQKAAATANEKSRKRTEELIQTRDKLNSLREFLPMEVQSSFEPLSPQSLSSPLNRKSDTGVTSPSKPLKSISQDSSTDKTSKVDLSELADAVARYEAAESKLKSLQQTLSSEKRKAEAERQTLSLQISELQSQLNETQIDSNDKVQQLQQQLSESEAHSRVLETSVEALRRDASAAMFAAQRALEDAAQETLQAQAAVTQLEAALPGRIQSALLQAKSEWDAESQRQRVYELDLTRQRSLDEANRRASQDISAFRTKLSDRAQEVSELQHQLQELQNTLSSAQSDRDREQRGHADMIAAMELQLSNRNQQLAELRSELSSSAESLFKVQSQLRDATELSEVSQSRHTTEIAAMSESHASALALLTAEHTSLAQQLQSQQSQFNTLQQSFNQLSLEQSEVISQREALTEQLRLCELKIQQIGNENNFAQQESRQSFDAELSRLRNDQEVALSALHSQGNQAESILREKFQTECVQLRLQLAANSAAATAQNRRTVQLESTLQTEQSTNSALRSQLQQKSAELQQLHQQHSMLAQSFELSLVQHQQDKQQLQNRAEQSVKQLTLTFQVELDSLRQKEQSWRAKWDELQHSAVGVHQDLAALQTSTQYRVNELESLLEAERRAKQSAIEENTRLEQDLLLARQSFEKQQNDQQIRSAKLAKLEEEKLRNFSLQLEEKNQTVQQLQRQLDVLNEDLSGFKSQTQQLSADCSALQLQNERLSDELMEFKSKSNVESGELAHNLQQIGQLQLELAAAQTEYSELQNRLRTIEEQSQNDLRTLEEQLQKQTADLDDIRLQLHDRDADLVTKVSEIEALNSTIIALQKSVDADVLRADTEKYRQRTEEAEHAQKDAESRLSVLRQQHLNAVAESNALIKEYIEQVRVCEEETDRVKRDCAQLQRDKSQLEQASIHSNAQLSTEQNRRRAAEAEETLARAELLKWRELVGQMNKDDHNDPLEMFELKKQVADQQSRLQTLQSQLDESQRTIAEQTKIMHQQTQALERESGKETEMETLRQKADTVDTLIEELNDQAAQLTRIRKDFKTSSDEKQRLQSVLSALESEKMASEMALQQLKSEYSHLQSQHDSLQAEFTSLQNFFQAPNVSTHEQQVSDPNNTATQQPSSSVVSPTTMSVLERVALRSSVSREQLLSNQFNINSRNNSHSVLVSDELGQPLSVRQSDSVKQLSSLAPLLPPASLLESESSNSQDKVLQLLKLRQQQQQNQRAQQAQQAQQAQANQLQLPTQQHTSANLTPRQLAQQVKPASSPPTVATVKSVHQQMSPPTIHVSPAHQSNSSASNQKNLSIMVSPVDALSASPSVASMISQRSFTELHADLASGPNDDVSQADFMRKFHDYQQSHREQQDKLQSLLSERDRQLEQKRVQQRQQLLDKRR